MKNQKGFVFPITVAFTFFIIMIFIQAIELYKLETEFSNHEKMNVELDSIMKVAVNDIKIVIASPPETKTEAEGTIEYPSGRVSYRLHRLNQHTVKVNALCLSKSNKKYEAEFTLSLPDMQLMEWKEKY